MSTGPTRQAAGGEPHEPGSLAVGSFANAEVYLRLLQDIESMSPAEGSADTWRYWRAIAQLRNLRYGWVLGERQDNPAGGEPDYRIAPQRLAEGLGLLCD